MRRRARGSPRLGGPAATLSSLHAACRASYRPFCWLPRCALQPAPPVPARLHACRARCWCRCCSPRRRRLIALTTSWRVLFAYPLPPLPFCHMACGMSVRPCPASLRSLPILCTALCPSPLQLLSGGRLVFHGPREAVLPFFQGLGFACPLGKGTGDFLQEVTSFGEQRVGALSQPETGASRKALGSVPCACAGQGAAATAALTRPGQHVPSSAPRAAVLVWQATRIQVCERSGLRGGLPAHRVSERGHSPNGPRGPGAGRGGRQSRLAYRSVLPAQGPQLHEITSETSHSSEAVSAGEQSPAIALRRGSRLLARPAAHPPAPQSPLCPNRPFVCAGTAPSTFGSWSCRQRRR